MWLQGHQDWQGQEGGCGFRGTKTGWAQKAGSWVWLQGTKTGRAKKAGSWVWLQGTRVKKVGLLCEPAYVGSVGGLLSPSEMLENEGHLWQLHLLLEGD